MSAVDREGVYSDRFAPFPKLSALDNIDFTGVRFERLIFQHETFIDPVIGLNAITALSKNRVGVYGDIVDTLISVYNLPKIKHRFDTPQENDICRIDRLLVADERYKTTDSLTRLNGLLKSAGVSVEEFPEETIKGWEEEKAAVEALVANGLDLDLEGVYAVHAYVKHRALFSQVIYITVRNQIKKGKILATINIDILYLDTTLVSVQNDRTSILMRAFSAGASFIPVLAPGVLKRDDIGCEQVCVWLEQVDVKDSVDDIFVPYCKTSFYDSNGDVIKVAEAKRDEDNNILPYSEEHYTEDDLVEFLVEEIDERNKALNKFNKL